MEKVWPDYGPTASGSILNAYYTDPDVVAATWSWLVEQGVTTGHGFEPGCGRGTWMAAAPTGVSIDAVDIDPISVKIARLTTGQRVEVARIEDWNLARSSQPAQGGYDFVVGNVPFSSNRPGRNNPHRDNLHNLAVLRSAEMLRPGGVATVITSRYALDAATSSDWRRRLAEHVDLVAAFRLPSGTHRQAGTAVVTDLLVLRRPLPAEQRPAPTWIDTTSLSIDGADDDATFTHNRHFAEHPERVLGTYEPGGAWSPTNFSVRSSMSAADALRSQLADVRVAYAPEGSAPATAAPTAVTQAGRALPAGSIVVDASSATGFSRDGVEHKVPRTQVAQLTELCAMRDAVLEYLDAPTADGRVELLDRYEAWRSTNGPLNDYSIIYDAKTDKTRRKYPPFGGFRRDPSWWNVAALEVFDDDTHSGHPAPLLQQDRYEAASDVWPDRAATLAEAVANSMARFHHIDTSYVAGQLDVDDTTVGEQLAEIAYENPASEQWEIADTYLAGDVVAKLDDARHAADEDPDRFARNVEALTAALPTPLTPAEIHPELGVTWLSAEDMTSFLHEHLGSNHGRILYHPPSGAWSSEGYGAGGPADFRTARASMLEQIVNGCNAKPTTVFKKVPSGDSEITVVDSEATAQEQLCRDNINEALVTWCWADPERAERLAGRYNQMFNRHRVVDYDGSHLTLPGLASDFVPRPHQKDVVWRILTSTDSGTLMAHGVGAGKTAAMVIAAQEARRTGRVPGTTMFAVPRNMVEQFARDYLQLYPAARVITPQKSRASQSMTDAVAEFAARVATGDFDAAICSHEAFVKIPLTPDVQRASIERRISDYEAVPTEGTASRRQARNIERTLDRFRSKLEGLADAAEDPSITYFDRLNLGMVFVDEAHLAKNIALMTAREGLPMPDPSQRAEGILARADLVRDRHGDGAVVMATATPVTNSPAEMWVFARLVSPQTLERAGIAHFDGFAANFLSPVATVEHTADRKLKMVTRLADYRNFPDLARLFRSFADVRQTDQLGFDLPDLAGGQATVHLSPPTDQQLIVTDWATERVAGKHLHLPDGVRDPIVAILHATRAASLHPATISDEICERWATVGHPNLRFDWDEPNPKLIEVADTVAEIYHRTADHQYTDSTQPGAAQVVFCDQGVPRPDSQHSVYQLVTDALVNRGVDRDDIAWVHDWPKPDLRQPLWDDVRNGNVRVVLGSTMQMGVGVNIQSRLYAAHELTAPYRPDWLTQAEGRMIRQGNEHPSVELHRYVTEQTADASMWQILERKARFITTAMSHPDDMTRNLRDESVMSTAEEYAQISALATGDQRHIELASVTGTIDRLERAARAHSASRSSQQQTVLYNQRRIDGLLGQIVAIETLTPQPRESADPLAVGEAVLAIKRGTTEATIAGVTYETRRSFEGLSLDIPDTALHMWIDADRLRPDDGGRGLGRAVLNLHDGFGQSIAKREDTIGHLTRQVEAEQARPVPERFPRQGELDTARERRDQLTEELNPKEPRTVEHTGAAPGDPASVAHPVYGDRNPSTSERYEWAGAYRRHNPAAAPNWGNRAKGADAWVEAVNAWSLDPDRPAAKIQPIGQYHGVMLVARHDGDTMSIAPQRHHDRFNALSVPVGQLDRTTIESWLTAQSTTAAAEIAELRGATTTPGSVPDQARAPER